MQSLSASSLSACWILTSQDPIKPHSNAITALVLPILAAFDSLICLSLTCTIIPLWFLSKEHLKNTVGAIQLFAKSLFLLMFFPGATKNLKFNLYRPFLASEEPIKQLILRYDLYGSEQVKKICLDAFSANRKLQGAILFAQWDPSFASAYLKNSELDFEQAFLNFIIEHPEVENNEIAKKLFDFCHQWSSQKQLLFDLIITRKHTAWLAYLLIEDQNKGLGQLNFVTIKQLILRHQQHKPEEIQKICAQLAAYVNELDFSILAASWDVILAKKIIANDLPLSEARLLFIKSNPSIPAEKMAIARKMLTFHDPLLLAQLARLKLPDWLKLSIDLSAYCSLSRADLNPFPSSPIPTALEAAEVIVASNKCNQAIAHELLGLASDGNTDHLRFWITANVSLNLDFEGETALITALRTRVQIRKIIINFLLDNKADPNIGISKFGEIKECSALFYELYLDLTGKESAIDLLLAKGAKLKDDDQKVFKILSEKKQLAIRELAAYKNIRIDWLGVK